MNKLSRWSKDVKIALIERDMSIKELAESLGYSVCTLSNVINGRYANSTYKEIVEKVNKTLGTEGEPERISLPSDDWCQSVKIALLQKKMSMGELAEKVGFQKDVVSLVCNGRSKNPDIICKINDLLEITEPAVVPADT